MPGIKGRKELMNTKTTKRVWRRRRRLQIKIQVQVQVELVRGDGRYQQLLEGREIQYFEAIFLTFYCYILAKFDGLALPKEG
jgi:hypothetical protein